MPDQDYTPKDTKIVRRRKSSRAEIPPTLGSVAVKTAGPAVERPGLFAFTMLVIYKNLYILGVTMLRRGLRIRRRVSLFFRMLLGAVHNGLHRLGAAIRGFWRQLLRRLQAPFRRIAQTRAEARPRILEKRARGAVPWAEYGAVADAVFSLVWKVLRTLFNYAAPVVAAYVLLAVINDRVQPLLGLEGRPLLGLEVEYNGEVIGYVKDEAEFDEAVQVLLDRFISIDGSERSIASVPRFALAEVEPDAIATVDELADKMVRASGSEIANGYGLYIDDVFYGALESEDFVPQILEQIKKSNSTHKPGEDVKFIKSIRYTGGLYPLSSFVQEEMIGAILNSNESVDEIYEVQAGDTPTGIAQKVGVPYSLLKEINPGIEENLQIGMEIKTAVARPFLSVRNIYTTVVQEELPFEVEEVETSTYAIGYQQVTQEGVPGIQDVTVKITMINGVEVEREVQDRKVVKEAVVQKVIVGTNNPQTVYRPPQGSAGTDMSGSAQANAGGFIWPTNGGYINGGIGSYPGHTGVDIPRPYGTPVYASASGTVVLSKKTYVNYGFYVIIDHGNGFQTLYAHNSELYVNVGDTVTQGQVIAAVGRTGRATGNHVHFEVRYYGQIMNPRNYIGG